MRKALFGGTALAGVTVLMAGAVGAAEAPEWKLSGNMNFQLYYVDHDYTRPAVFPSGDGTVGGAEFAFYTIVVWNPLLTSAKQDHAWYFGVDEAELQLNVSGTADNGLNYGFKIEINANTTDGPEGIADEARIELSGSWGTLQMGDEDGAEDIMNYGGENLMGATGGFDGDQDDVLYRVGTFGGFITSEDLVIAGAYGGNFAAPGYPTISGDTGDATKVSYYSPRFSGFQVGASITPTPNSGDDFKEDGDWENHIGIGANYDNSFGDLRLRASVIYSGASSNDTEVEDVSAWSVGGIVGWGPFSLGANYTDNADSRQPKDVWGGGSMGIETSYWDVAASFETGPMSFAAGYFEGTTEVPVVGDSTYEHISLTADYNVAPGLGVYAEYSMISDEFMPDVDWLAPVNVNSATTFIAGANISF